MESLEQHQIRILKNKIRDKAKLKMKIRISEEIEKIHKNGFDVYSFVLCVRPKDKEC